MERVNDIVKIAFTLSRFKAIVSGKLPFFKQILNDFPQIVFIVRLQIELFDRLNHGVDRKCIDKQVVRNVSLTKTLTMKSLIYLVFIVLLIPNLFAQHYSGYYVSDPPLEEYHHFKIHQKDHGSHLMVKALMGKIELWETEATVLEKNESLPIIEQFANGAEIDFVYELNIAFDGTNWKFFMLSYHDHARNHGAFKVVEEVFESNDDEADEVKRFEWYKSHHVHY